MAEQTKLLPIIKAHPWITMASIGGFALLIAGAAWKDGIDAKDPGTPFVKPDGAGAYNVCLQTRSHGEQCLGQMSAAKTWQARTWATQDDALRSDEYQNSEARYKAFSSRQAQGEAR